METPKIEFSAWYRWNERGRIENFQRPGVYMLAKFKPAPLGSANPLDENIIYFGETCNQNLKQRWNQFEDSAFEQKRGHSGGRTYGDVYGDKGSDLYVAAMPVTTANDIHRSAFIRFAERKLILDFVTKWKRLPSCNRK